MTVSKARGAKAKADRLWSQLIRARGACQACGTTVGLQACHIVGRSYATTRTDLANGLCLCGADHYRFDNFWDDRRDLLERTIGLDEWMRLKHEAQEGVGKKVDWFAEAARLGELVKQLEDDVA